MNRAPANRSVTLRLLRARRLRRLTSGLPLVAGRWSVRRRLGSAAARSMARSRISSDRSTTASSSASSRREQLAELALVELAEPLEQRLGLGRRGDDDLAAIVGVVVPVEQAELDEAVDEPLADDEPIAEPARRARTCAVGRRPARRTGPWPGPS